MENSREAFEATIRDLSRGCTDEEELNTLLSGGMEEGNGNVVYFDAAIQQSWVIWQEAVNQTLQSVDEGPGSPDTKQGELKFVQIQCVPVPNTMSTQANVYMWGLTATGELWHKRDVDEFWHNVNPVAAAASVGGSDSVSF